ncbi:NAD(P)-dependent oxidoreductase [Nocardia uniformis]|uniref:NAD(P)-dependent oxidoreductase n=1 Tax=Nocardia uniformis TaxID=53432 RepID=A0A849CDZ8_9NOCA|nr:NAD(P)-binding domain-containing protein [Nocardia uniformis]NNH74437.1 NAD(P)-dependent oxidoreductase [Nocardia uniformis]
MSEQQRMVTVIGLGPMGQAMVRAFLAAGVAVTVWNRSAEKADAMVELGAKRADTVAEALTANEVIVLSLTHYSAMYDVLGQVADHLRGKVIANLSSDSPENARKGAAWAEEHGAQFLTGGVIADGESIESPESYIFYSGPRAVFDEHADLLRLLTPTEYLGEDPGLSQVYYQGLLILMHPLILAYEQALATIERSGQAVDDFVPHAVRFLDSMKTSFTVFSDLAKSGGWGDISTMRMMDASTQHAIEASTDVGVDAALLRTAQAYWRRALAATEAAGEPVSTYRLIRGT